MPLSEHEQRLLDQIERGLYADDPKFAQTVQARDPRTHYKRRIIAGAVGFIAGVCLLMGGAVSNHIAVGVVGFVVMLATCVWGLSSWKRMAGIGTDKATQSGDTQPPRASRPSRPGRPLRKNNSAGRPNRGSFMERLEERWRRRREQ